MAKKIDEKELENVAGGIEYRHYGENSWCYEVEVQGAGMTIPYTFHHSKKSTVEDKYRELKAQIATMPQYTITKDTGVYFDNTAI